LEGSGFEEYIYTYLILKSKIKEQHNNKNVLNIKYVSKYKCSHTNHLLYNLSKTISQIYPKDLLNLE